MTDGAEDVKVEVVEHPAQEEVDTVVRGLGASNQERVELREEWERRTLSALARRDERLVGGAIGQTAWGWLYIARLWVTPELREKGIGSQLMAAIESAAQARGCVGAWLDTFSFQERPFYEAVGYRQFAELADFPPGHIHHFLSKAL